MVEIAGGAQNGYTQIKATTSRATYLQNYARPLRSPKAIPHLITLGDGLVERMNRTLLNLLRTYTQEEGDWEEHLQLLLFVYRTTKHSSTGLSPHEILFGYNPPSLITSDPGLLNIRDPVEYSDTGAKRMG